MQKTDRAIDAHLTDLEDRRGDMQVLHGVISRELGDLKTALFEGKFWGGSDQEIIGYGVHDYVRPNGTSVEWFLVGLALQKNYISVYVSAVEDGAYLAETHGRRLGKVKVGKSSISFGGVADIELDELGALVRRARELTPDL